MPGIAGVLSFSGTSFPEDLIVSLGEALCYSKKHLPRWVLEPPVALAWTSGASSSSHEKLARDAALGVTVILYGEIYPDCPGQALMGAEQILSLYLEEGLSFPTKLNGRFAIAIHDSRSCQLLLVTDHHGTLPLYILRGRDRIAFASRVRALLADPSWERELDLHALLEILSFGCLQGDRTLFKAIRVLSPGTILVVKGTEVEEHNYFRIQDHFCPRPRRDLGGELDEVRSAFNLAVEKRCESTRAALLLTGGLDSRTILSSCLERETEVSAYTYGLEDSDDVQIAEQIASLTGIRWRHLPISNEECYGPENLQATIRSTGGNLSVIHSIGISTVSELANAESSILLGNGSEFLRGGIYDGIHEKPPPTDDLDHLAGVLTRRFNTVFPLVEKHGILRDELYDSCRDLPKSGTLQILRSLTGVAEEDILDAYFLEERTRRYLNSGGPAFFGTQLFCRFPFYDALFLERCFCMDRRLRSSLSQVQRYIISKNSELLARAQSTFSLPILAGSFRSQTSRRMAKGRDLLRKRLRWKAKRKRFYVNRQKAILSQRGPIMDWLQNSLLAELGIFDPAKVATLLREEFEEGYDRAVQVGAALTLELFCREFLPRVASRPRAVTVKT
jgi:asparagine synthetase B (glutamine-hydrolysing)